jgi:AcrR family transcriptional regulator
VSREAEFPSPPWQRTPTRTQRRRAEPITPEGIVRAALEVLDTEGLDALSMRRVADALGTGPASLYWHVGSKHGLLDLVFDEVIAEQTVPAPDPDRWREQLAEVARAMRRTFLRHRDLARIAIGRVLPGPNALEYTERVLAILDAGGVPDRLAAYRALAAIVNGFAVEETGAGGRPPAGDPAPDEAAAAVRDYLRSLPADRFPNLVALADQFSSPDPDQRFETLLGIYLDGLARRAVADA